MTNELICVSAEYVESSILKVRGKKIQELERRLDELQRTYDGRFRIIIKAIRQLMMPSIRKRNPIGFRARIPKK